jgi:hypothetical protein
MFNKIFLQGLTILILLIFSNPAYSMSTAGYASRSGGLEISSGEPARAELTGGESAGITSAGAGLGMAYAKYYLAVYEKEYFYRENNSQPIRDFRYYNVKTIVPASEKKNYVIRDFRRDMWENKSYK